MVKAATDVVVGLLLTGSPDPCISRWFSCAVTLRAVGLGVGCHSLLQRAWPTAFRADIAEADGMAAQDDAVDINAANADDAGDAVRRDKRKRARKVTRFFERQNLWALLVSCLTAISPVEKFHFTLCKADVARKGKARKREAADRADPNQVPEILET